jgi:hypothetical protein
VNQRLKILALVSLPLLTVFAIRPYAQNLKNAIGMEFVRIPAGEFMMGCSTGDAQCVADESPRHRVQITKSFEIGKYEVTQAQWVAIVQTNPSSNKGETRPVETVTKLEVQDFIAKLNTRGDGYRYRLPTEAEWEYAARAGVDAAYAGPLDQVAWYAANSEDETHPVGLKKPNAWGLYDVQGNVREWVSDFYTNDYYSVSPAVDPVGPQLNVQGRGALLGRGLLGRGGPVGPPPPINLPPNATPEEQIQALRQEVAQLRQELQQLRNEFEAGPPRGGLPPRGGPWSRRSWRPRSRRSSAGSRHRWSGRAIRGSARWSSDRTSGRSRWRLGSVGRVSACVGEVQLLRPDTATQRYRVSPCSGISSLVHFRQNRSVLLQFCQNRIPDFSRKTP